MLSDLISRAPQGPITPSLQSKGRRIFVAVAAAACYVLSVVFNVVEWQSGTPWAAALDIAYQVVVIGGFILVWLLLSHVFKERQAAPLKIFWTTLFVAFSFVVVTRLIVGVALPSGVEIDPTILGFEYGTGVPLTIATVVKMNVLSLFKALFAFYLLLRFRDLVLFKRTKRSQRNWYLMLAFMGAASLSAIMKDPTADIDLLQGVAVIPAVMLMAINSFRVSWIVFLSFREKAAGIGLSILLMVLLGICLSSSEALPGLEAYLRHYSYPLQLFTELTVAFGLLYCVTSFLFLVFHLPTTSDFQRKAGEVTAMHSLTNLVSQVFDPDKLYFTITATPVDAGTAQMAWLATADARSGSLRPKIVAAYNTNVSSVEDMIDVTALYEELDARREPITIDEAAAER